MAMHDPQHRFNRCPSCRRHVRQTIDTQPSICPFCRASMTQAQTPRHFPGRGGMLATSLLSAGLVGWDTPSMPSDVEETPPEPIPEAIQQPLYGMPTPIPIYGIPSPPVARWALSIEGTFGLGAQTQSETASRSTDPLVALTPALERIINRYVAVGLELGVAWLGNPEGAVNTQGTALTRTQVLNPNLRVRLSWPIVSNRFHLTTTLAGGAAFWCENGSDSIDVPTESNRLGFGLRANVGGAFMIDEAVEIFLTFGYFATHALSDNRRFPMPPSLRTWGCDSGSDAESSPHCVCPGQLGTLIADGLDCIALGHWNNKESLGAEIVELLARQQRQRDERSEKRRRPKGRQLSTAALKDSGEKYIMATRRVSKHGLSGCPSCGQHVKLEDVWRETVCPFCNTLITKPTKARAFPGRGGLLAASLLSVGLIGCDKDPDPSPDAGMGGAGGVGGAGGGVGGAGGMAGAGGMDPQPAPEPAVQPLYGEPDPMPAPEPSPMPEYGTPPPDMGPAVDMALAPDGGDVPEYGIPPMPDAGAQMDMAVAPDAGIMPEYGAPPVEPDAGTSDAAPDADPEPAPAPLYGIPPEGE